MAIRGERRETLERWLFNFAEPPFPQTMEQLAEEYRQNLEELHRAEDAEWLVEDLRATPEEIRDVIDARMDWLRKS